MVQSACLNGSSPGQKQSVAPTEGDVGKKNGGVRQMFSAEPAGTIDEEGAMIAVKCWSVIGYGIIRGSYTTIVQGLPEEVGG